MRRADIVTWLKTEFSPVTLATPDVTLNQIIENAIRYFNTHSGFKMVSMLDLNHLAIEDELMGVGDGVNLSFNFTVKMASISTGTLRILTAVAANEIVITDNGAGLLVSPYATGTVNYLNGDIVLLFNSGFAPNLTSQVIANYEYSGGNAKKVAVDPQYKMISKVYPAIDTNYIWADYSFWTLLGKTVMDNTMDMIALSTAYKNYAIYIGADFRWTFEKPSNPTQNGFLYITNMPQQATRLCLLGAKRILADEDIESEHILAWLLYYSKALLKMTEGNTLRKADIINVRNDGDRLVQEGVIEAKDLEVKLAAEGRWLALARRF